MVGADAVRLVASDGSVFEVEREVAMESVLVTHAMDGTSEGEELRVPLVCPRALGLVLEFARRTVDARRREDSGWDGDGWARGLAEASDQDMFQVIYAANFMHMPVLLDAACRAVRDILIGLTPEQIRERYKLERDLTPEEEAEILRSVEWDSADNIRSLVVPSGGQDPPADVPAGGTRL
jgi:S-phase kinase-associated protein 1